MSDLLIDSAFTERILCSKLSGNTDALSGALTIAQNNTSNWHTGRSDATTSFASYGDALERKAGTFHKLRDFTVAGGSTLTWDVGSLTLSSASALFENYTWQHLDRIYIASATGLGAATQVIVTGKTSDYAITVATDIGATDGATDVVATLGVQKKVCDVFVDWPDLDTGWIEWSMSGIMSGSTNISDTTYTYTEFTVTVDADWPTATTTIVKYRITKAAEFASYTWVAGDRMFISGGTGVIPGWYVISRRVSDDAIELQTSIGAAASGSADVAGRVYSAQSMVFRLYRADPSGLNPTNLLLNPTTITIPDINVITGANTHFELNVKLRPIQPEAGTTNTQSYAVFLDLKYALATSTATGEAMARTHCYVARGTVELTRPSMFYLTYQKPATNGTFDFLPRSLLVTHKAPRIT